MSAPDKILVTAKTNPDLDGTACAMAYAFLLKKTGQLAEAMIFGELQPEAVFFKEKQKVQIPVKADDGKSDWSAFVLVDASSMVGMPKTVRAEGVVEIIDHREQVGENEFLHARIQNELVGAAATLVFERMRRAGVNLPRELAMLIYGAIFHNTLNLLSSNLTPRDTNAITVLENKYKFGRELIDEMFRFATDSTLKNLEKTIELDAKQFKFKDLRIGSSQLIIFDAERNLKEKEEDLTRILESQRQDGGLSFNFITAVDLNNKKNVLFCPGAAGQKIISKAAHSSFTGNWAKSEPSAPIFLRKQLIPKIKNVIEQKHI